MTLTFAPDTDDAILLHVVPVDGLDTFRAGLTDVEIAWLDTQGFKGKLGQSVTFPSPTGGLSKAAVGLGDAKARARKRFGTAGVRATLPAGTYRLATDLSGPALDEVALGWLLAGYRFDRYAKNPGPKARLIAPEGLDAARIEAMAAGEALTRDLINTPANDLGPDELEAAARALADTFDAGISVIKGTALLDENLPLIHAVGRASPRAPRLIDLRWGTEGPRLTLVGKGVCFDTGGLNLKPASTMGLMKKDMGGAATVLGLAQMIMATGIKLQLRVLIPAVENAVDGGAIRPGDVLPSRKGLTVEINNTDAEGRLVLADALAVADDETPDLIVSMATLTGAARVAVGPDLAPFYATLDTDAAALKTSAARTADPVWEMPFWPAYEPKIEPGIADLDNAPAGGFAGSITAALFLKRFVTETERYLHFDIFGWQPTSAPARPKGGVGQGARALLEALPALLKL